MGADLGTGVAVVVGSLGSRFGLMWFRCPGTGVKQLLVGALGALNSDLNSWDNGVSSVGSCFTSAVVQGFVGFSTSATKTTSSSESSSFSFDRLLITRLGLTGVLTA